MQKTLFFLAFCLVPLFVFAQSSKKLTAQMQAKYPNEKAIYLTYNQELSIDFEGDTLNVISHNFYDMLHLSGQSEGYADDNVASSHFIELLDIQARTLVPNKNKYKTVEVSNFLKKDDSSSGVFYDDNQITSFNYPSISVGARTILDYKRRIHEPRFLNPFYFGSYVPVEQSQFVLRVHKDIDIEIKEFNIAKVKFDYSKKEKGDYITHTWLAKNLDAYQYESNAPKASYFMPHLIYYIKSAKKEGKTTNYLSNLDDLYNWYYDLTCTINQKNDVKLQAVVDGLIKSEGSQLDKVRKIFYWVQDNIKYIAFENGMQGFIPDEAQNVYQNRYGDCKGMSSITHQMLKMAGIESSLTWIGSRSIPYKYSEVPTPLVDNHMIVTYQEGGKIYFLDATNQHTSLGFPSSMIQGKEALVSLGDGKYKVAIVPTIKKEKNSKIESLVFKLEGDKLVGKGKYELDGYQKSFNAYRLEGLNKEKEKKYINAMLRKGNNKFLIESYKISNFANKDKPLLIEYEYNLDDYVKLLGDEIYINLNLDKSYFNDLIDIEKRELSKKNEYQHLTQQELIFEIPDKYEIDYLPPNQKFDNELFGFDISYQVKDKKVYQNKEFYLNYLMLEKESFKTWNQMIKKLSEAYREVLILKKK